MKTCLITGASGGIAKAMAERLTHDGWTLALASRDVSELDAGPNGLSIQTDVSQEAGAFIALQRCLDGFSRPPDAVVNCAGAITLGALTRTSESQYRACLSANLDTAFFTAKAYVGLLQAAPQPASLVLFSSVAGRVGIANHPVISMAKAGIEGLTRSLALDYAPIGLRTNAIAPGLVQTSATARMLASPAMAQQLAQQYPLGRYGKASDAASLAAFLISDQASWINGQVIGLDGGFAATRPFVRS